MTEVGLSLVIHIRSASTMPIHLNMIITLFLFFFFMYQSSQLSPVKYSGTCSSDPTTLGVEQKICSASDLDQYKYLVLLVLCLKNRT